MSTLTRYRGDSLRRSFTLTEFDGTPLDLTDAEATFSVKADIDDVAYIFQLTGTEGGASAGITYPDPSNGVLSIDSEPGDMQSEVPGNYVWDLQVTLSDGRVESFPRTSQGEPGDIGVSGFGTLVLKEEVTRP